MGCPEFGGGAKLTSRHPLGDERSPDDGRCRVAVPPDEPLAGGAVLEGEERPAQGFEGGKAFDSEEPLLEGAMKRSTRPS